MSLRGSLQSFSLPDILQLLSLSSKTGALHVASETGSGIVWCTAGAVSYAAMAPDDAVRALVEAGLGAEDAIRPVVDGADPSAPWGPALIERGVVDEDQLRSFLAERTEQAMFEVLLWDEGDFEFLADEEHSVGPVLGLAVEPLLATVRERVVEWRSLRQLVPLSGLAAHLSAELPEGYHEVTLTAAEWRIVAAANGSRVVTDIAEHVGQPELPVSHVLRDLVQSGLVYFAEPLVPATPAPEAAVPRQEPAGAAGPTPVPGEEVVAEEHAPAEAASGADDGDRGPWALRAAESAPTWETAAAAWEDPAETDWHGDAAPAWSEPAPTSWETAEPAAWSAPAPEADVPAPVEATSEAFAQPVTSSWDAEPSGGNGAPAPAAEPAVAEGAAQIYPPPFAWDAVAPVAEPTPAPEPVTEWHDPWSSPPAVVAPAEAADSPGDFRDATVGPPSLTPVPAAAPAPPPAPAPTPLRAVDPYTPSGIPVADSADRYRDRYAHLYEDAREDEPIDDSRYERTAADLPRRTMLDNDLDEARTVRRGRGDLPKIDRNVLLRMLSAVKDL
jgi:hypothetical protein